MRKRILTVLAASLMAASTVQMTAASERHHARKAAPTGEQFRNTNNALAWPAQQTRASDYTEGHVISAPAGH
jgi:Ni/Co efflux regulator RcnB